MSVAAKLATIESLARHVLHELDKLSRRDPILFRCYLCEFTLRLYKMSENYVREFSEEVIWEVVREVVRKEIEKILRDEK